MFKCPQCGYDESKELMKKYCRPSEHEQCHACEWWTCADFLGSYCSKFPAGSRNTTGDCKFFKAQKQAKA